MFHSFIYIVTFLILVPSSAPTNVTAITNGATSINVTWDEVPPLNQNGIITGYIVFYKETTASGYTTAATMQRSITIQGLQPLTQYAMRVLAYNSNGNGIASEHILLFTAEQGRLFVNVCLKPLNKVGAFLAQVVKSSIRNGMTKVHYLL